MDTCDVTRGLGLEVAHGLGGGGLAELLHLRCRLLHLQLDLIDRVILFVGQDGTTLELGLLLPLERALLFELSSGFPCMEGDGFNLQGSWWLRLEGWSDWRW